MPELRDLPRAPMVQRTTSSVELTLELLLVQIPHSAASSVQGVDAV